MIYLKTSVGIEIREGDLVVSCLRSNFSGGVFTDFKRISEFRQRERDEVRREIDRFFKERQISRDNIVLGVPRADVILRYLDLPKEVEDNLKQVVLYQVQSYEPTEEEKFYFDYAPLKATQNGRRLRILLLMIRKSILDAHLEVLRELGLRPVCVMVGSVSLANMFFGIRDRAEGKTFVLADLKSSGAEVMIVRDGALLHSREAPRREGVAWRDLLLQEVELAAGNVRMGPDDAIESIVLAGEASETANTEVREDLPECELIGDLLRFEMPVQNRPRLQEAAASLGLAYSGMTRRLPMKFNLLPSELRIHQTRWAYVPTIVLALALAAVLAGLGFRQMFQERILIRQLDQEIEAIKPRVDRVQAIRGEAESLEKKIVYIEGLLRNRDQNLEILQELTTILPADTYLHSYNNREGNIQITGSSSSAPDLIPKLEKSPLLKDIEQRGPIFKDARSGKDRFIFQAKCERGQ